MIGEMDEDDSGTVDFEECVLKIIHKDVITVNIRITVFDVIVIDDIVIIDIKLSSLINDHCSQYFRPFNSRHIVIDFLDPLYN